jgi:hypothetical protein
MVDNDIILSSKNSGWTTPSSFLPQNQVLLTRVWMIGDRNIPVFCSMSYSSGDKVSLEVGVSSEKADTT